MKMQVKQIAKVFTGTTPPTNEQKYYESEDINWYSPGDIVSDSISLKDSNKKISRLYFQEKNSWPFPQGAVLMVGIGATVGKVAYSDSVCWSNQQINVIVFDKKKILPKFGAYQLLNKSKEINKKTPVVTLQIFNQSKVRQIELWLPSLETQHRIVTYLDTKLSEIDHQVAILTSKRDAYLRLKKSIINHAVTRGLDPNVKMKDSGIEWIGEVPEHWEVKRMKDIVKLMKGRTPEDLTFEEISYPYLTMDYLRNRSGKEILYPQKTAGLLKIDAGEIIVLWDGANAGEFILSKEGYLGSTMAVFLCDCKIVDKNYLYYLLKSVEKHSKYFANGTTIPHFDSLAIMNHQYALPPLPEQRAIATYLDDKCAKIDTIVSNLDKQISRYADLKRSLIDEVITGKRAV